MSRASEVKENGRAKDSPVPRLTLVDSVYQALRQDICSGELSGGDELNQVDLARRFGVSRVPVREALRRLQAEGMIEARAYQRFAVRGLSPDHLLELIEIREELEVLALRRTLRLRDEELAGAIAAAKEAVAKMKPGMPIADWMAADRAFHRALYGPAAEVRALIEGVRDQINRYLTTNTYSAAWAKQIISEHTAIIKALESRDPAVAEQAMRTHVRDLYELLRRTFPGNDGISGAIDQRNGEV